jgi:hypothetical protein
VLRPEIYISPGHFTAGITGAPIVRTGHARRIARARARRSARLRRASLARDKIAAALDTVALFQLACGKKGKLPSQYVFTTGFSVVISLRMNLCMCQWMAHLST